MSKEHEIYLKHAKRKKIIINFFKVFIIIFILVIWEVLAKYNLHISQGCECGCQDVSNENIYWW